MVSVRVQGLGVAWSCSEAQLNTWQLCGTGVVGQNVGLVVETRHVL